MGSKITEKTLWLINGGKWEKTIVPFGSDNKLLSRFESMKTGNIMGFPMRLEFAMVNRISVIANKGRRKFKTRHFQALDLFIVTRTA